MLAPPSLIRWLLQLAAPAPGWWRLCRLAGISCSEGLPRTWKSGVACKIHGLTDHTYVGCSLNSDVGCSTCSWANQNMLTKYMTRRLHCHAANSVHSEAVNNDGRAWYGHVAPAITMLGLLIEAAFVSEEHLPPPSTQSCGSPSQGCQSHL